jgi:TolB-like protein
MAQGDDVIITLEAIDVRHNRVVWQKTLPPSKTADLIGLQTE